MTREEAIANLNMISVAFVEPVTKEQRKLINDTFDIAIEALELVTSYEGTINKLTEAINQKKEGYCKDCKWWKDSDGTFKRGIGAESQCPINRIEVFEGTGYCYMFEPQESEDEE